MTLIWLTYVCHNLSIIKFCVGSPCHCHPGSDEPASWVGGGISNLDIYQKLMKIAICSKDFLKVSIRQSSIISRYPFLKVSILGCRLFANILKDILTQHLRPCWLYIAEFFVWCIQGGPPLRALQQVQGHLAELSGSVTMTKAEMVGWACKVAQITRNLTTCSSLNNWRAKGKPEISKKFSDMSFQATSRWTCKESHCQSLGQMQGCSQCHTMLRAKIPSTLMGHPIYNWARGSPCISNKQIFLAKWHTPPKTNIPHIPRNARWKMMFLSFWNGPFSLSTFIHFAGGTSGLPIVIQSSRKRIWKKTWFLF